MSWNELLNEISHLDYPVSGKPMAIAPRLVGLSVRFERERRLWKQKTLANLAQVSLSTIERAERGERVSEDSLEKIAQALDYEYDHFTAPRRWRSKQEAAFDLPDPFSEFVPVEMKPFRTERQVREMVKCSSLIVSICEKSYANMTEIRQLRDRLIRASSALSALNSETKITRREHYNDVLDCVDRVEAHRITVLAGIMDPQEDDFPDYPIAIVSMTSRLVDPEVPKRRIIRVDPCCYAFELAGARAHHIARLEPAVALAKAEHRSLFRPAHGDLGCQVHQLLGRELGWVFAVENGSDDVGRERRQTQQA